MTLMIGGLGAAILAAQQAPAPMAHNARQRGETNIFLADWVE